MLYLHSQQNGLTWRSDHPPVFDWVLWFPVDGTLEVSPANRLEFEEVGFGCVVGY